MLAKSLATPGDRGSFGVRIQGRGFSIEINEELGFGEQTRDKWGKRSQQIDALFQQTTLHHTTPPPPPAFPNFPPFFPVPPRFPRIHGCVLPIVH